jgi:hypothetical protein
MNKDVLFGICLVIFGLFYLIHSISWIKKNEYKNSTTLSKVMQWRGFAGGIVIVIGGIILIYKGF